MSVEPQAPGRLQSFRPPPPTLILYVLRELAGPTLMGFGLFTFILLMNYLLTLAELIFRDGVGIADVSRIFLFSVTQIVVLSVPMAVLGVGLVAFCRLSSDSEIIFKVVRIFSRKGALSDSRTSPPPESASKGAKWDFSMTFNTESKVGFRSIFSIRGLKSG